MAFQNREATPLVLVTLGDLDNAWQLPRLSVAEVVWLDEASADLLPAVRRAETKKFLFQLRKSLEGASHLPGDLRLALFYVLDNPYPVRSQNELAVAAGCNRSTLYRQWRTAVSRETTLKAFLDWVLLIRALSIKRATSSWRMTAARLEVPRETLSQMSRRLVGINLNDLPIENPDPIFQHFQTITRPLLHLE